MIYDRGVKPTLFRGGGGAVAVTSPSRVHPPSPAYVRRALTLTCVAFRWSARWSVVSLVFVRACVCVCERRLARHMTTRVNKLSSCLSACAPVVSTSTRKKL